MSERTFNNLRAVLCKDMNDEGKDGIGFTCNINDPKDSPAAEYNKVMEFLKEYGKLVTPGFNIYRPDFDLGFLCDLIERYKLKRHIRLGLAHPGVGIESTVIDGSRMARMAERLIEQLPMLERHKIEAGPDCGFPMCAFTDEQLGKLLKTCGWHAKFDCSPAIDVGPDMNVWACFPISSIEKRSIFEFATMEVLMEHFKSEHKKVRTESGGIFERCGVCQYLDRVCMGGCLSHGLNRAAGKPLELAVAAA
jgi:radical SAM protein with 4Fe4S-binding SPASM domain